MGVKIRIVQSRGNHVEGHEFEADEQVARQLVAEGIARIVQDTRTAELVTETVKKPAAPRKK